jgi:hypothetical protein
MPRRRRATSASRSRRTRRSGGVRRTRSSGATEETRTRAEELRAEVQRLEARRQKVVDTLRRISSHIEGLVTEEPPSEEPSLPEALSPDRRSLRRRR